jgi:nucleoside-triphosphatase
MKHLLITGKPGVGKTTLIREVSQRLKNYDPVGFYTQEIRVNGHRQGFRLLSLDGRSGILSHIQHKGPHRVGRYGVDLIGFERFLTELDLCHSPSQLVILDEIGKMECLSTQFRTEVEKLLDSSKLILATIALKGEGFISQVKQRPDCRLIFVTLENRDRLIDTVMAELLEQLRTRLPSFLLK